MKFFIASLAFLLFKALFIMLLILTSLRQDAITIEKFSWKEEPSIIICNDSGYSKNEAEAAINFWKELGYNFKTIAYDFNCSNNFIAGFIIITTPSASSGFLEHTDRKLASTEVRF